MTTPQFYEKVDLFLSANSLPKMQTFSQTDSFAVLYLKDVRLPVPVQVATTVVAMNTDHPEWILPITVDYLFESPQEITVKLYQYHNGAPLENLNKHELIGQSSFQLVTLMRSKTHSVALQLLDSRKHDSGTVVIKSEVKVDCRDLFCVAFQGQKLLNKAGFLGTSDPFLTVSRLNEDESFTVVWKSNKIDNTLDPKWSYTKILVSSLCNNDMLRPLKIEVFDWHSSGNHVSMGEIRTNLQYILANPGTPLPIIEKSKQEKSKSYQNSGFIVPTRASIEQHPSFGNYISAGLEISLAVAIDYTGSNGDPDMPNSLHYISPVGVLNPYQLAILSVARILEHYDSDKKYPVLGFGAKIRNPDGTMTGCQHCFPINGGGVEVDGVAGIMQAYKDSVTNVLFSGPTLFSPLIQYVTTKVTTENQLKQQQQKHMYTILLIITDGVINDLEETKAAIIQASKQPLSIIIIGVGDADFTTMNALDGDKNMLSTSNGQKAVRDIVQFVSYRGQSESVLAQQVLEEIPSQVVLYMEQHGIVPSST